MNFRSMINSNMINDCTVEKFHKILFKDYGNAEGWPLIMKVYPSLRARLDSFGFEVPYFSEI